MTEYQDSTLRKSFVLQLDGQVLKLCAHYVSRKLLPTFQYKNFHCGLYIPLSDDKHPFVWDSSLCTLEIWDNVRDKNIFWQFFFSTKIFFLTKINFFSYFVSDYMPQLYFVCNHLILFVILAESFWKLSVIWNFYPIWRKDGREGRSLVSTEHHG